MIDIIMPCYNMKYCIKTALASVAMQEDLENIIVTIIDDHSDETYDDIIELFSPMINIRLIRKDENQGCGQARQTGIDNTECEYFMFLDADDAFASPFSVKVLYDNALLKNANVIISDFIEQREGLNFISHNYNNTWMHGKMFKTSFIKDNNIRFNESRENEDSAFFAIILSLTSNVEALSYTTYFWKNNKKSSTRICDYEEKYINIFVQNGIYATTEMRKLHASDKNIARSIFIYLTSMYGYYLKFIYSGKSSLYIQNYIKECGVFYRKSHAHKYLKLLDDHDRFEIYSTNDIVLETTMSKILPKETIFDFINKIKE